MFFGSFRTCDVQYNPMHICFKKPTPLSSLGLYSEITAYSRDGEPATSPHLAHKAVLGQAIPTCCASDVRCGEVKGGALPNRAL